MSTETNPGSTPATPAAAVVAAPNPSPTATQPATGAAQPAAPVQPQTVTIPLEQLQTFTAVQARLAQLEADVASRESASRAEQVKIMAAKGDIENAMKLQQEENRKVLETEKVARTTSEERAKRFARDAELLRVLSGHPLVPGGADQLSRLFASDLVVDPSGDTYAVRTPTFQSVGDFVAERLAKPEYSHFVRASNPGGGTAGGGASGSSAAPTPGTPAAPTPPKNFGEAIIMQMASIAKEQPSDARLNPAAPMGLNRRSMIRQA